MNFQQVTRGVVSVNPEFAMLCRGAKPEELEAMRVRHGPHANAAIRIYMNDPAATAFQKDALVFPVGAVVVKQKTLRGSADGVGGMVKRPPGYDPGHGDWEYFYFDDASKIESGRISSCVQCHDSARDRDHLFGTWREKR